MSSKGESGEAGHIGLITRKRATEGLSAMDGPSLSGRSTEQQSKTWRLTKSQPGSLPRPGWQVTSSVRWDCLKTE